VSALPQNFFYSCSTDTTPSAIPNGVVNSFSTVIIKDMGFSTTKTTELKSVGDAVQIIALIISGSIILNVPNCTWPLCNPPKIDCF
jgi:hypothetical protein